MRWFFRPIAAVVLLLGEYLAISFSFDAYVLLERAGDWGAIGFIGMLGPIAIAFATALWLLGGAEVRDVVHRSAQVEEAPWFPLLLVQLVCFSAFFGLSAHLFGGNALSPEPLGLWVLLWVLGGAATFLAWLPLAVGRLRLSALLKELAVPLSLAALLGLVAWGAGIITLELWQPLGDVTLDAVAAVLEVFVQPIVFDPNEAAVGTEAFGVTVAPVCSGYEGIGLVAAFLMAYLIVFREQFRFPHVLVLLPLGILAVWALNVVRIVALILVGHLWSPEIAIGGFHSKAGWVFFCAVALGAVWVSQRVPWLASDPSGPRARVTNPSAPFLLPLLAVVATALITGLFVSEFDYFYPLRVGVALTVLAWFRKDYVEGLRRHLRGRSIWSWQAPMIGVVAYLVWIALWGIDPSVGNEPPAALAELSAPAAMIWIAARVFGSTVTVPIVEELAFRGFLLRRLISKDFTEVPYETFRWPAVLISSLAFAAVHQQWIAGFVAGLFYAYAQSRRGLLTDAIIAHAVTNALIAAQVLLAAHWSLW
ncbi:MAG: exosortase E/protease, VPEID-CTERM system [Myxococcales bacterium]|nr:exosortase E/protease, VPEID-CTERM system [Myxococcales bacterium]